MKKRITAILFTAFLLITTVQIHAINVDGTDIDGKETVKIEERISKKMSSEETKKDILGNSEGESIITLIGNAISK